MKLKIIFSMLLIASLILISVDTAVAQYGNSEDCQGTCDQLRERSCQDPVANCGENCIPAGDEHKHKHKYRGNR